MQQCDTPFDATTIEAIVFDFDNVIVRGSEACKRTAWGSVFDTDSVEYKKLQEAQTLFAHGKGDRFDILGYVLDVPTGVDARFHAPVIAKARQYDEVVQKCIASLGIVTSDLEAILLLYQRFPLYIVSATPEEALRTTLLRFGEFYSVDLLNIFRLALGTPLRKSENLQKVHEHSKIPFGAMLMVGDGQNDYEASKITGTSFLGVTTNDNELLWRSSGFTKITAIDEIPTLFGLSSI